MLPFRRPPRLSIVVPFHNVEHYLGDCLDSLARQTYRDFEVILVDDGSKDSSAAIARAFCATDDRFRIVTQENQGLGPARNTGVQHSQGEYLTFVDSDDLLTRHAYEIMVRSLDETSSSLAAGNARRFNNTSGVRMSFVHRLIFTEDRPATHVFDFPILALDRMVWNKVYRRRFWDQFAYKFPAIRYEDYPVTLRAHVDAVTVDLLAAPVYYWRERESGESITQGKFKFANLADRVASAELVFDLLDERASELRPIVHDHFVEFDLATVVQAFDGAAEHELAPLVDLGHRLTRRLDAGVLKAADTYERLQYRALQTGDVELLRRLARFRAEGGLRGGARARPHPFLPWRYESQYPGAREASGLPARAYRLRRKELELKTTVSAMAWDDEGLTIRGTAEIQHLATEDTSTLRITLRGGRRPVKLPVTRFVARDLHGERGLVGFSTTVPRTALADLPDTVDAPYLSVELRNGPVRRSGPLQNPLPGSATHSLGDWVGDAWIQPIRTNDGRVQLRRTVRPPEVTSARFDGDDLVLAGRIPTDASDPVLRLARSTGEVAVPLDLRPDGPMAGFTARIAADDLLDAENPDDPFLGRTVRVPRIDGALLLVTGVRDLVAAPLHGRLVSVSRSPAQFLNLVEKPLRVTADRAAAEGSRVSVSGPRWPGLAYDRIVWRRFLPDTDDAVDLPGRVYSDGDRWVVEADASELPTSGDGEDAPVWTLFTVEGEHDYAVQAASFLVTRLPIPVEADGESFVLQPRTGGTLHLESS